MFKVFVILAGLCWSAAAICPHQESGLTLWSTVSGISKTSDVEITTSVLIDVALIDVNTITVKGAGRLIFNQGLAITVKTKSIMVQDNAALVIGSEECRHEDDVNILLEGERSADREGMTSAGEKYIAVLDAGSLQIYGKEKLAWTKLASTVNRFNVTDSSQVAYSHVEEKLDEWRWNEGFGMYRFCCEKMVGKESLISYEFYDTVSSDNNNVVKEVNRLIKALDDIVNDEIISINLQYYFKSDVLDESIVNFTALYDKIEDVAGVPRGELLLRKANTWDAYALVFVTGLGYSQAFEPARTSKLSVATASMIYKDQKLTSMSKVYRGSRSRSNIDFRLMSLDAGYPTITVLNNVRDTWSVGDEVLLTTTDFAITHGEVRKIKEFVSDTSFKLDNELEFRHYGEIYEGVDMRGEVALLSRNIRIEGVMGTECGEAEDCKMGYSTHGGHLKVIESFGSVVIDGAAFRYMGQAFDKGTYPIHFHMCRNITGKTAIVRNNVIRDSFSRAVTVHGTFGTSESSPGVQVLGNVAHNIYGHIYFLEDGAEMATIFIENLASQAKRINNGFETDKAKPTGFWITNPKTVLINNVAAGCHGYGFWYTFPLEPVGPSKGLVYARKEAKHTPLWTFDNNVAHSNDMSGLNFDNILDNANGRVVGCMNYEPVIDPLDRNSDPVKVQLTRFTGYKNYDWNMWLRGGYFEVIQMSSAESRKGLQTARASKQPQFVKKSIFIGQTTNSEEAGYPDAETPEDLGRYSGFVVYDGPAYVSETYFDKFAFEANDTFFSTAIGFSTKNKFFSSVTTSFHDIRFGFSDTSGASSKRVFDGNVIDDAVLGFGDFDGDESATLRDIDGSISRCPGSSQFSQLVKPEKYAITENCALRENWKMAVCNEKYGKVYTHHSLFNENPRDSFDPYGTMRRRRYSNATEFAYEDHSGNHRTNFLTVLGNSEYYYEFQYHSEIFPRNVQLIGTGIERGYPLVVGLCLPEGITKEDISIRWASPDDLYYYTDSVRWVDNLQDVATDGMPRMFLNGRMLYMYLTSKKSRNNNWDAYDYYQCPGDICPSVSVTLARNLPSSPCFDVPESEIDAEYFTEGLPKMTCDLPATAPGEDWGAGDTTVTSRDGNWGEWGQWSACCNEEGASPATTYRYRMCDNPPKYGSGADCPGATSEEKPCERQCSVNGVWSSWSSWSDCFCDGVATGTDGVYTRRRECVGTAAFGEYCRGGSEESRACNGNCEDETTFVNNTEL